MVEKDEIDGRLYTLWIAYNYGIDLLSSVI